MALNNDGLKIRDGRTDTDPFVRHHVVIERKKEEKEREREREREKREEHYFWLLWRRVY